MLTFTVTHYLDCVVYAVIFLGKPCLLPLQ